MSLERRLGLKDDERLLALSRAAAVTRLLPGLVAAALLSAPFFFMVPLLRLETLGVIIMTASGTLGALLATRLWVLWHGTFIAVTDRRLIVVRRAGLFDRQVTEVPFSKLHEVSYRVHGPFAMLFGYGTLMVETAGSDKPLELAAVPRPARLKDLIADQQEETGRGPGDFGAMLHAVSGLETRKLKMLRSEIDRTLSVRPGDESL